MSPLVRNALTILILVYSIFQIANDNAVMGLIGVALAAALFWLGRKR